MPLKEHFDKSMASLVYTRSQHTGHFSSSNTVITGNCLGNNYNDNNNNNNNNNNNDIVIDI